MSASSSEVGLNLNHRKIVEVFLLNYGNSLYSSLI